jgi:ABC-type Mn2+/Zn2+ transport system ATPase subunit
VQCSEVTNTFPITAAEAVMVGRWRRLFLFGDASGGVTSHLCRLADVGTTVVAATHDARVVRAADRRVDLDELARRG